MASTDIAVGVKNNGAKTKAFFTHCRGRISNNAAIAKSAAIPAGVLCGVVRAVIERPHPSAAPDGRQPGATVSHPC